MRVTTYSDPKDFLCAARDYLEREEAAHGLILGIASSLANYHSDRDPVMLTVHDGGRVALAMLQTPPKPLLIAGYQVTDTALGVLVDHLLTMGQLPSGLVAAEPLAGRMADWWQSATRCTRTLLMSQRIYQLTEVTGMPDTPGRFRKATSKDLDTVTDWWGLFTAEATPLPRLPASEQRALATTRIQAGEVYLWEDSDRRSADPLDRPVSMAMVHRPTRHGVSVGGVYTPHQHRGRGYATACVSSLSHALLARGYRFCCLYTDLSNPTSNSIYQKIGYRAVTDSSHIGFEYGKADQQ